MELMEAKFGDKTLTLSALTMGDLSAFRNHLRKARLEAVRTAFDGMPEKVDMLQKEISATFTNEEMINSLSDIDSILFLFHRSISKKHPEITFEKAGELITTSNLTETAGLIRALLGGSEGAKANPPVPPADK